MQVNPKGKRLGEFRLIRGGSWGSFCGEIVCSTEVRDGDYPSATSYGLGFRIIMEVKSNASKS